MIDSRSNVLALDTAGPEPGLCLLARGEMFEQRLPSDRQSSERLLPSLRLVLQGAGIALADCGRIAACSGPGSFTGLRIGLATAWGLGRALEIPVEEVSTLEALAEAFRPAGVGEVTAVLDAGRGEVVVQGFSLDGPRARPLGPARRTSREEAEGLAGPVAVLPADLLGSRAGVPFLSLSHALAAAVSAAPRDREAGAHKPRAIYSRPSAAEEKRGAS